jgi:COMPASS component SWD3
MLTMRQVDSVIKENKKLKLMVEQLERENRDLRKSVFDLNLRSACLSPHVDDVVDRHVVVVSLSSLSLIPHRASAVRRHWDKKSLVLDIDSIAADPAPDPLPASLAHTAAHATPDNTASSVDAPVFHRHHELRGHEGPVYALKYSACGRLLASGLMARWALW